MVRCVTMGPSFFNLNWPQNRLVLRILLFLSWKRTVWWRCPFIIGFRETLCNSKTRKLIGTFMKYSKQYLLLLAVLWLLIAKEMKNKMIFFSWNELYCLLSVRLGSIPDLPAENCKEIKESEGEWADNGNYWFYFLEIEKLLLAYCDMRTEGK